MFMPNKLNLTDLNLYYLNIFSKTAGVNSKKFKGI